MSKFEKLLDLLVNEQKDEAEKLFHEIVVEKSRGIYEGILADEEAEATEESADQDDADEVDEAMHKDKKEKVNAMAHGDKKDKKEKLKAGMYKEDVGDDEDEDEKDEPAESADETIEEIGGDATDDLLGDIESENEGMHDMDMGGEDDDNGEEDSDFDDDGDDDEETEEMFEPLEKELDQLKAEFAKMMDKDDDKEKVNAMAHGESADKDADTIVKEYAEMVKSGHGAEKMGKEAGADQKKSPVAGKNKPVNDAKAHSIGGGAEEKGGVGKALTGDTAKPMGKTYKNAGGSKSQKLDMAPKAQTSEGPADAKSPVASK